MADTKKTHWKKLHNPDYLGAYSLMQGDTPIELTVTIKSVSVAWVMGADGKKEDNMVAQIVNNKPMVINATNAKVLEKLYSPYVEDWAGKQITLFVAKIKAFGEVVDALRIRPKIPVGAKESALPELTPTHEKWEGAKTALIAGNTTIEAIRKKFIVSDENEKLLTAKEESAITIDDLRELLDLKRDNLTVSDLKEANRIINSAEESSYASLHEVLKSA